MKNNGYTLIEILLVMLLLGILSGIIFSTYRNFIQEYKSQSIGVRKEMELLSLQIYLRKLIQSIGFGIPREISNYQIWNSPDCTDSDLFIFKNSTAIIGLAKDCSISNGPKHDRLYFRSLFATGAKEAGCWWVISPDGEKKSMAVDKYGFTCNAIHENDTLCYYLDENRNYHKDYLDQPLNCTSNLKDPGFLFFYTKGNETPPEVFRLHLSAFDDNDIAQKQACAPKSGKLMLQREWNIQAQPIFDCVGGLKFDFIGNTTNNLPSAIQVCLLVQVSGRLSTKRVVPLNSQCGPFQEGDPEWKYYRWRVIEEIIPLENLRGIK